MFHHMVISAKKNQTPHFTYYANGYIKKDYLQLSDNFKKTVDSSGNPR